MIQTLLTPAFDFFISYRQADASDYARQLENELKERGFLCFLDTLRIPAGADFRPYLERGLKRAKRLILLASEGALKSEWVSWEVDNSFKQKKRVIAIEIGDTLREAQLDETPFEQLKDLLRIQEPVDALLAGPSTQVFHHLTQAFAYQSQIQRRQALFVLVLVFIIAAFIIGVLVGKML